MYKILCVSAAHLDGAILSYLRKLISSPLTEEKDQLIEEYSRKLEEESVLREQLQTTISTYAQAELDKAEHMEEREQEFERIQQALAAAQTELEETSRLTCLKILHLT